MTLRNSKLSKVFDGMLSLGNGTGEFTLGSMAGAFPTMQEGAVYLVGGEMRVVRLGLRIDDEKRDVAEVWSSIVEI